jgi:hypothetical protein
MAHTSYRQLGFGFQPKLRTDFDGGTITTDGGLALIREFDEQSGLTADLIRCMRDSRDPRYTRHSVGSLVRQRLYQIVAGYEDANDADRLRSDPTFQLVAGDGSDRALASQPTLSRLENAVDWASVYRLSDQPLKWFCRHAYASDEQPEELLLDVDSTDDPTHGNQQFALFHGAYDQHMYHPLCWFEAHTGLVLRTRLRPGLDRSSSFLVEDLHHMLPGLRRRFPSSRILLRGDAGMATPEVELALEEEQIDYVIGMATHAVFKKRVAPIIERAQRRYERQHKPVSIRTSFRHRARSWPHQRRILVKIDVSGVGLNVRFMVTNRSGRSRDLIAWYDQRGTAENYIKELKLDIQADRLSCHLFRANAFRFQLHTLALALMAYFRRAVLAGTPLAQASIGTIRLNLLKVGARVLRSARRIRFHLASHWPGQDLFLLCHQRLRMAPT